MNVKIKAPKASDPKWYINPRFIDLPNGLTRSYPVPSVKYQIAQELARMNSHNA